jgi:hypothetical protein
MAPEGVKLGEATQLFRFILSIDLGAGCQNTAQYREKNEQEPHHAVSTLLHCHGYVIQ